MPLRQTFVEFLLELRAQEHRVAVVLSNQLQSDSLQQAV